jgi:outer membrane protein assembly factor BamB
MTEKQISLISAAATAVLSMGILAWWFAYDPTASFIQHGPGMDNRTTPGGSLRPRIQIGRDFTRFDGAASDLKGLWPAFRGPGRDNILQNVRLRSDWAAMPEILWSVSLGEGHAAPAVAHGRVYVLDYLEAEQADALRCFSLDDGKEIWRRSYPVRVKRNHGMSRTIPAVSDSFVVTIGPRCQVMCVHAENGDFLWGIDLEAEYGTEVPFWYTGQCPLIDRNVAVIAPGGRALLIGVDCATGHVLWETPNPEGWKMSHSSVMPVMIHGKPMYIYCTPQGVVGVSADSGDEGRLLWKSTAWSHSVIAPSPLALDENRLLLTAGYGAGSMILQINQTEDSLYTAEVIQACKPEQGFASEQQTPVYYQGNLYGVMPKDAGALRSEMVCADPSDLTRILWSSGKTERFGLGPYLVADGKILLLKDDGQLHLIEAAPEAYTVISQAQIFEGHDAWGPMALVDGRLLMRDANRMYCVDVGG